MGLTRVKAQITGVEVSDYQAGTQPDAFKMAIMPAQVEHQDVTQVHLQAGPAGTRRSYTCQVCRTGARSAPTILLQLSQPQPQLSSESHRSTRPVGPVPSCSGPSFKLSLPDQMSLPLLGVLVSKAKGN